VDVPSPFDSGIAAMALVEAILAGVLTRLDHAARARMAKLEETSGLDKVIGGAETTDATDRHKAKLRGRAR
jgi:hypothetical protein